ncbi:progestin and adipoQ receptor-like protein 1 [Oppia nitens]|uniref:progestin and adipoQ receptor-like protein 1 n=1 Tax=Oppia nitens TaxID=1686743 RepID=UPI0023DB346C|nr:progestin and adipoQ receptor-like protein 1 [Oppia nitens]
MQLLEYKLVPKWLAHNKYILTAYRPPYPSFWYCLKTVIRLHNETGNIFTHMIAFFIYCILFVHTMKCHTFKNYKPMDGFIICLYFVSSITCYGLSTLFHLFKCHSCKVFKFFAKLDYLGITLLMVSSNIVWIYYTFYNVLLPKIIHMSLISIVGISGIIVTLRDGFSDGNLQVIRGVVFLIKGLFAIAPIVHFCSHSQFNDPVISQSIIKALILLLLMAAIYISGVILYMTRIPERFLPGMFDLWFHSHQLFHMCSIVAGICYYQSVYLLINARLKSTVVPTMQM